VRLYEHSPQGSHAHISFRLLVLNDPPDRRLIASPPLTLENALPLAAQATLLEAPAAAPDKVRPVASAAVAAGAVLAIHTLDPAAAQYLQLALAGGWCPPGRSPLAISPASLAVAAALAGPAEAARARAAANATGTTTNTLLLRAPDGRTVHVSAEHGSVSYRSPLAPRVTRLGRAWHVLLATSRMPFNLSNEGENCFG